MSFYTISQQKSNKKIIFSQVDNSAVSGDFYSPSRVRDLLLRYEGDPSLGAIRVEFTSTGDDFDTGEGNKRERERENLQASIFFYKKSGNKKKAGRNMLNKKNRLSSHFKATLFQLEYEWAFTFF